MGFQTTGSNETQDLLQKWCGDCHAAPRPSSHARDEWRAIIQRMQQHRSSRGLSPMDDDDMRKLTHYYQSNAPL